MKRSQMIPLLFGGSSIPAPAAPTGLAATVISTSRIDLAWTDAATTETEYRVYRSTDGVSYSLIDTIAASSNSYSDTTITAGTTYYYKVAAYNVGGETLSSAVTANTLTLNLAAWWKMDEAAGVNRADSVGSSTAVLNGTVAQATGKVSNGASFNGNIANFLSVADNAAINPAATSWTIAFWYKLNSSANQGFIAKIGGSGGNEFIIDVTTVPVLRLLFYGATTANVTVTPTLNTTTFYAIRAWYDLPTNKIWLQWHNGTAASADAPSGGINVSNGSLRFGVFDGSSRPGNSIEDEIGFWRRALTADEWTAFLAGITYSFS